MLLLYQGVSQGYDGGGPGYGAPQPGFGGVPQPGGYPQQPGGYPQQPGGFPQPQAGGYTPSSSPALEVLHSSSRTEDPHPPTSKLCTVDQDLEGPRQLSVVPQATPSPGALGHLLQLSQHTGHLRLNHKAMYVHKILILWNMSKLYVYLLCLLLIDLKPNMNYSFNLAILKIWGFCFHHK